MLPFYTTGIRRPFPEPLSGDSVTPERPLPFKVQQRVRWSDCDPLGIIWYGTYLKYFEAAEHDMMRASGLPYETLRVERGVQLPRRAFSVEFQSPAQMDEMLDIEVGIARIGATSIRYRFAAYKAADRTLRATATLTVVAVKAEQGKLTARPIPDWLREALTPYLAPEE
jgi:acyl-CoA thioester hydrolase